MSKPARERRRFLGVTARISAVVVSILMFGASWAVAEEPAAPVKIDFTRDIRPILSDKCFKCHGADPEARKGKLRLDTSEGTRSAGASGEHAVVPGDLDASELIARVSSDDAELHMPPAKSGKTLSQEDVATLTAWVRQGAEYTRHWAFVPPVRPELPAVKNLSWCGNPIDRFVLAKLESEGLTPSAETDRVTLVRRVSLDLTGLPPSPEEVDAFLADKSDEAYGKFVDRLLASPRYGERWGRVWLDAARYADSDGYEKDKIRQVWAYRDWVINAHNRDLPYNQFLIEQFAGDLLPNPTQDQRVATGFLRNSMINEEGGVDPEQFRMEAMFDRMEAVGKGVLGLTIQCAQCHTHKFDPILHEDYYKLFAFLNDTDEANIAVYTPAEQQIRDEIARKTSELESSLRRDHPDWGDRLSAWEAEMSRPQPDWRTLTLAVDEISTGGCKYVPLGDGSLLESGYAPTKHKVQLTSAKVDGGPITAVRLDLMNDPNLPLGGPGRSIKGTGALTEIEIFAAPADAPEKREKLKILRATADVNPPETLLDAIHDDKSKRRRVTGPIEFALDGKDETAWGIDVGPGRRNVPRKAVFTFEKPVDFPAGAILTIYLQQNHGGWNSDDNQNLNLGRFKLSATSAADAAADPLSSAVRSILGIPLADRTPEQSALVFSAFRPSIPEWKEANDAIEALWKTHPEGSSQLVLAARERPRNTSILDRGDFLKPTRPVEPGVPEFLNPLPEGAPKNRLTLARWITARDAPTTARAFVNRVWQNDFGTGLVASPEDLGTQSEAPSHPQLLDWLAVEFMDNGWSMKHLHRLIVTSSTYKQSSNVTPDLHARDPYNRLLARGPRFRIDAELVRDYALEASGLLDSTVGGPSVFPPAPEFLFQPPTSYGPKIWNEAKGPSRYRRALYTFRYRSVPYPMLQTFDAPNGDSSCVRRSRSNTPLQALTTLNEPLFLECARALALKTINQGGDTDADRLTYAFRRCVSRPPSAAESAILLGLLERQTAKFQSPDAKPWDFAAADPAAPPQLPDGVSPAQAAAWTAVSRVLLNLDETITKE